ncbi:putative uncharacterized protein [Rhodococcus sp. AW25M09]|uniref:DUF3291 domain-containing protein n=1 Tax=Rhodococcus sp. AW25M09 TaxID=1268303 RepID=UPI0002ACE815|nr:DUF3291 domain-containing protein [Rhodococcus sp. AW25M09]CCQ16780.1 putative uncharacterized protein [Rhodococcus sp. AW25M09]
MATLPWVRGPQETTDLETAVVMASRFELTTIRRVVPFLVSALRIHNQVRKAKGAIGVSLIARPLRREFYTLSAWRDRAAVDAMVRIEPHLSVMSAFREHTTDARFTFWDMPGASRPTWADAFVRLADEESPSNTER